jgi:oligopeptide/dipeptide ABC transporter ATP-binding protein
VADSANATKVAESDSADAEEKTVLTIHPSTIARPPDGHATVLLEIDGVSRTFGGPRMPLLKRGTAVRAVDQVSFNVAPGEAFGLVGESGSGKTTIGRMIVKLIEPTGGHIRFGGTDISTLHGSSELAYCRGVQMVFQNPYASLNPRRRVRDMISEAFDIHSLARGAEAEERMSALMQKVGLSPAMLNRYPHQFSSGQRQRIAIARALSVDPALVVADEPVSALDVSVQAQVLNLLRTLQFEVGIALIFISHDLRAVSFICERIGVLYLGRIVEIGPRQVLLERPVHPYTRALFRSLPSLTPGQGVARDLIVGEVAGQAPAAEGCVFAPRCELRLRLGKPGRCETERPVLREVRSGLLAACHFAEELANERTTAPGVTIDQAHQEG